jgi:hypothetical protein
VTAIRRAIIRTFDAAAYTADVEIEGYPQSLLKGVPVAWDIDATHPADGVSCVLILLDDFDPRLAVVAALFGAPGPP